MPHYFADIYFQLPDKVRNARSISDAPNQKSDDSKLSAADDIYCGHNTEYWPLYCQIDNSLRRCYRQRAFRDYARKIRNKAYDCRIDHRIRY